MDPSQYPNQYGYLPNRQSPPPVQQPQQQQQSPPQQWAQQAVYNQQWSNQMLQQQQFQYQQYQQPDFINQVPQVPQVQANINYSPPLIQAQQFQAEPSYNVVQTIPPNGQYPIQPESLTQGQQAPQWQPQIPTQYHEQDQLNRYPSRSGPQIQDQNQNYRQSSSQHQRQQNKHSEGNQGQQQSHKPQKSQQAPSQKQEQHASKPKERNSSQTKSVHHQQQSNYSNIHLTMFPIVNEFLQTAHSISWGVVTGHNDINMYRSLIACAMASLESILKEGNRLHPFIDIQTRLKLASILTSETSPENWEEVDRLVNKGISLAKSYRYYGLAMDLKYASIQAMSAATSESVKNLSAGDNGNHYTNLMSLKSIINMLDTAISEALVLANDTEDATSYFSFLILKISILFRSQNAQDINEGIRNLEFLQKFEGSQDHVAHFAYTLHALKLFQMGRNQTIDDDDEDNEKEVARNHQKGGKKHLDEVQNLLQKSKNIEQNHGYSFEQRPESANHSEQTTASMKTPPSPNVAIPSQLLFMRIICETLVHLERCNYEELERAQRELFTLMDSPDLLENTIIDPATGAKVNLSSSVWPLNTLELSLAPYISQDKRDARRPIGPTVIQASTGGFQRKTVTISWLSVSEARILSYMLSGLVNLRIREKSKLARRYLKEALKAIKLEISGEVITLTEGNDMGEGASSSNKINNNNDIANNSGFKEKGTIPPPPPMTLTKANHHYIRLLLMQCFTLFILCLEQFSRSKWKDAEYLQELLRTAQLLPSTGSFSEGGYNDYIGVSEKFVPLTFYLSGVYFQASGNVYNAIQFFLKIRQHFTISAPSSELYILATINLVLILEGSQGQEYNNEKTIRDMEVGISKGDGNFSYPDNPNNFGYQNSNNNNNNNNKRGNKDNKKNHKNNNNNKGDFGMHQKKKGAYHSYYYEEGMKGLLPAEYYRKELLRPVCKSHPSPMIQWAIQLLDIAYDSDLSVLKQKQSHSGGNNEGNNDKFINNPNNSNNNNANSNNNNKNNNENGKSYLDLKTKLSLLLKYAVILNTPQTGAISSYFCAMGVNSDSKRQALLQRGLSDAYVTHNAIWGWMIGIMMERIYESGISSDNIPIDALERQKENNEKMKRSVENQLNSVD